MDADQFQQFMDRMSGGKRRLELFKSGDGVEWMIWRRHAEMTATINGWNHQRRRREYAAAMQGEAALWVSDIPLNDAAPAGGDAADSADLLDAYGARFLPTAGADVVRVSFRSAEMAEGETLLAWHSRIRNLFVRAYPNVAAADVNANADLKDRFILGIRDPRVREHTWNRRPADFAAALTEASNMAAGEHVLHNRTNKEDPFAVKREIHHLGDFGDEIAATGSKGGGGQRKGDDRECYRCHKKGHIARFCRSAAPAGGRGGRGGSRGAKRGAKRGGGRGGGTSKAGDAVTGQKGSLSRSKLRALGRKIMCLTSGEDDEDTSDVEAYENQEN